MVQLLNFYYIVCSVIKVMYNLELQIRL